MPRLGAALARWLPVALWAAAISFLSALGGPQLEEATDGLARVSWLSDLPIQGLAHIVEFAVLAILLERALRGRRRYLGLPRWGVVLAVSVAYGGLDELHQAFVPGRDASLGDVGLDALGAALSLAASWALGRWRIVSPN